MSRFVVWIVGLIVIGKVATDTCSWCVVVIAVVTQDALIGNSCMRTEQRLIIVVVRE